VLLLDTNVCVDILKGSEAVVERLGRLTPSQLVLCSVVKAELYHGARSSSAVARNLASVERFCRPYRSLPFDDDCARVYGQIRTELKRSCQMIGSNDLMIAATAIATKVTLVTHNVREFSRVPELLLEDWEAN
jgi:tRNA(fMet)-specific endonuclease VapC